MYINYYIMIPFYIQRSYPCYECPIDENIETINYCSEKNKMNGIIINSIIDFIIEFCSKDWANIEKINSYDDFRDKYWK